MPVARSQIRLYNMSKYIVIIACLIIIAGSGLWFFMRSEKLPKQKKVIKEKEPIARGRIIDYGEIRDETNKKLNKLMEERKADYGLDKSLDMIVKADESIKLGNITVSMKGIIDQVRLEQGEILEEEIGKKKTPEKKLATFGIYVVQPGDNIWNIHFRLLKEYFDKKGVHLSPLADEPDERGYSSGVGKILKFSENMVHIYNIKERRLDTDLNLIQPLSKIVIYNMERIFALLDRIDYKLINRIEFDGETLWLPAEQ